MRSPEPPAAATVDYTPVTETPGVGITREAARMLSSRYGLTRRYCAGRRVLEVACGSGQGLGYLRRAATLVCGGDITPGLLDRARRAYNGSIPLVRFDATRLPFAGASFDVVAMHEALYYLDDPDAFFRDAGRLLRREGTLVLSTVNPEWADFNPSPFARRYLTAAELGTRLDRYFRTVRLYGGFVVTQGGALSQLKRQAIRLHLMPRTMRGKQMLKRLFYGSLVPVPEELPEDLAPMDEPVALDGRQAREFKIVYAVASGPQHE